LSREQTALEGSVAGTARQVQNPTKTTGHLAEVSGELQLLSYEHQAVSGQESDMAFAEFLQRRSCPRHGLFRKRFLDRDDMLPDLPTYLAEPCAHQVSA
jgi:hypothetical protein